MATDSAFWNTVQREAAALLFPHCCGRGRGARDADATLDRTPTVPTDLTFALEDTAGFTTGDAIIIEPDDTTSSCGLRVLVSRGGITFAAAFIRDGAYSSCRFGVGCAHLGSTPRPSWRAGLRVCGCCPQGGRTRPSRLPNPRTADDTLASTGDCQERAGTGGTAPLVETSNGTIIIGSWS